MAKSKYEYVREFESANDPKLLPDSYVVVRVDGQCFHRFTTEHQFLKPNDKRCLDLMNKSALHVMRTFYPNIVLAYGQSDEYSFVIRRLAYFFNRRANKITSLITSAFTSAFVFYWPQFFNSTENRSNLVFRKYEEYSPDCTLLKNVPGNWNSIPLKYPPSFDGRAVLYPNERTLTDYLRWRQVDCHINNLYNTAFYGLTGEYTRYVEGPDSGTFNVFLGDPTSKIENRIFYDHQQATQRLSGTVSGDKNEILFTDYGVNYNNELEQFRKGTILVLNPPESTRMDQLRELGGQGQRSAPITAPSKATLKKAKGLEEDFGNLKLEEQEQFFTKMHCDIIGEGFWQKFAHLLQL